MPPLPQTLPELFARDRCRSFLEREFLVFASERLTFSTVLDQAACLGAFLQRQLRRELQHNRPHDAQRRDATFAVHHALSSTAMAPTLVTAMYDTMYSGQLRMPIATRSPLRTRS